VGNSIKSGEVLTVWRVLEQARASGLLWIREDETNGCISFRAGFAVAAQGSGVRIGDALVAHGVAPETVDSALRLQKRLRNRQPLGTLLAGFGRVGATTIREILQRQCETLVRTCLSARDGDLEFEAMDEDAVIVGVDGGVCFDELRVDADATPELELDAAPERQDAR